MIIYLMMQIYFDIIQIKLMYGKKVMQMEDYR